MKKLSHPSICGTGLPPSQQKRYCMCRAPTGPVSDSFHHVLCNSLAPSSFSRLQIPVSSSPSALNSSPSDTLSFPLHLHKHFSPHLHPREFLPMKATLRLSPMIVVICCPQCPVPRWDTDPHSHWGRWRTGAHNWSNRDGRLQSTTATIWKLKFSLIPTATWLSPNFQPAYPTQQSCA